MPFTHEELSFIKQRTRLNKLWPCAGITMILILAGLTLWLWFTVPELINPWYVFVSIEADSLSEATLYMLAAMTPVVVLVLIITTGAGVALALAAFSNERRLLMLIQRESGRSIDDVLREDT